MLDHALERWDAAVVHVGRSHRDVPQRRSLEFPDILRRLRIFKNPHVRRRIGVKSRRVIQPCVVKFERSIRIALRDRGICEVETAMATETRKALVEKENLAAL